MDDIDLMMEIASLGTAAAVLGMRAADLAPGECLHATLASATLVLSRDEAMAMAAALIDRRNALLEAAGPRAADRIVREIGYGYALMCDAEAAARNGALAGAALAAVEAPRPTLN